MVPVEPAAYTIIGISYHIRVAYEGKIRNGEREIKRERDRERERERERERGVSDRATKKSGGWMAINIFFSSTTPI